MKLSINAHVQLADQNHACIYGLSRNLFLILSNIPTAVYITCGGHGFKCGIYDWLVVINIPIGINFYCGVGC